MIRKTSNPSGEIFLESQKSVKSEEAIKWLVDFLNKKNPTLIRNYFLKNYKPEAKSPRDFTDRQLKETLSSLSNKNKDMLIRALQGKLGPTTSRTKMNTTSISAHVHEEIKRERAAEDKMIA